MRSVRCDVFSGDAVFQPERTAVAGCGLGRPRSKRHVGGTHLIFSLMVAILVASPALAEPRSIEDCEKIQAADAYNQCLASFGPVAHEHGLSADPEGGGAVGGHANSASAAAETRSARGSRYRYHQQRAARPRHVDPWANMRHAGRHRIGFTVR